MSFTLSLALSEMSLHRHHTSTTRTTQSCECVVFVVVCSTRNHLTFPLDTKAAASTYIRSVRLRPERKRVHKAKNNANRALVARVNTRHDMGLRLSVRSVRSLTV